MKNAKRVLALVIVAMMALSSAAFAEEVDLAAQLEAANARIAELEAQLEEYTVAAKFDGGIVTIDEVRAEYDYLVSLYSQYGYDLSSYKEYYIQDITYQVVEYYVAQLEAAEVGLDQFTAEELSALEAQAQEEYELTLAEYTAYFEGTEEEKLAQAEQFLIDEKYTQPDILQSLKEQEILDRMYEYAVQGVEVTDEQVMEEYETNVAAAQAIYDTDVTMFEEAVEYGDIIYYTPEGFRTVKHILLLPTDEQQTELDALNAQLSAAATDEEKAAINEQIDAIFAAITERTAEIYARIDAGEDFDALLAEYGEDPGMTGENVYYVHANSGAWVQPFTDGAMAIAEVGGVSEPVRTSYGIHIIKYVDDLPAGAAEFAEVEQALREEMLTAKLEEAYRAALDSWVAERNPQYFYERAY